MRDMPGIGRQVYTLRAGRRFRLLDDRWLLWVIASGQKQQRQKECEIFVLQGPGSVPLNILGTTTGKGALLGNFQAYFSRKYNATRQRILRTLRFIDS